jgi:dTDP-4-dehydrorhamnose 3,5-epimerase
MRFTETKIQGVYVLEIEPRPDERGFFGRAWCRRELEEHGLDATVAQTNVGVSRRRGTLRGLHYQAAPHAEVKLARVTRGAAFDVAVDLRPSSPTYTSWVGVRLSAANLKMLYLPEGCAHGYLTLADDTELVYQTSAFYEPDAVRGANYADPAFGIEWPAPVEVISEQDRSWPLLDATVPAAGGRKA